MSTIVGMITAFALVIGAIMMGGPITPYLNVQGMLIVVLGTFAVTSISFGLQEMISMPLNVRTLLKTATRDPSEEAIRTLKLAHDVRKQNDILYLGKQLSRYKNTPFLHKALQLVSDGAQAEDLEQMMRREASTMANKHQRTVDFLRRAGDVAPAMGLIGTLIGLVRMLGSLESPETIGPAMAVALLTTFYGALLAHLVFIPLAAKTENSTSEEALINNIYTMAALSIRRQENPRRLEMLLNTILPPAKRVQFFR